MLFRSSPSPPPLSPLESSRLSRTLPPASPITIETWFHVIQSDANTGTIPASSLTAQLDVINTQFAGSGFAFRRVGGTRTIHPEWYKYGIDNFETTMEMRKALRKGTYRTLNVYFLSSEIGILGMAVFPVMTPSVGERLYDGVVVMGRSVPGGDFVVSFLVCGRL